MKAHDILMVYGTEPLSMTRELLQHSGIPDSVPVSATIRGFSRHPSEILISPQIVPSAGYFTAQDSRTCRYGFVLDPFYT